MKTKKLWSIIMMLVLVIGTTIAFSSCSKDDEEGSASLPSYIYGGTWIAETYSWYIYFEFHTDGTYERTSESKHGSEGYGKGYYTYNPNTGIITCKGASGTMYGDGDVNVGEYEYKLQYIEKDHLLKEIDTGIFYAKDEAYDNTGN